MVEEMEFRGKITPIAWILSSFRGKCMLSGFETDTGVHQMAYFSL